MMKSLQGHLLVATKGLQDPNFFRTVVLLVQHEEGGALGLVLNRPSKMTVSQAWEQVSSDKIGNQSLLYQGGPCEGPLMVLHTHAQESQLEVFEGLYFCAEAEKVRVLIDQEASPVKFFAGYAGWSAAQLENEIQQGAWLLAEAKAEQVFEDGDIWHVVTRQLTRGIAFPGIDPKLIPPDPSVN